MMQKGWFHAEDNIRQIRILGMNYLELRPFPPTYKQVKEMTMMMIFYFDNNNGLE